MATKNDLGIEGIDTYQPLASAGPSVLLSTMEGHQSQVVLKILDPGLDPFLPRRFEFRHKALSQFTASTGVVPALDSGVSSQGNQYLVTPYYPEGSLADRIEAGPIPWPEAVSIVLMAAQITAEAHSLGVVLTYLRPSKIMMSQANTPLIAVFGTTTKLAHARSTPFLAPELSRGGPILPAADVYSLTMILTSLVVGQNPDSDNPNSLVDEAAGLVPANVHDVIDYGTSFSPTNRYGSAALLARALATLLEPASRPPVFGTTPEAPPAPSINSAIESVEPYSKAGSGSGSGSGFQRQYLSAPPRPNTSHVMVDILGQPIADTEHEITVSMEAVPEGPPESSGEPKDQGPMRPGNEPVASAPPGRPYTGAPARRLRTMAQRITVGTGGRGFSTGGLLAFGGIVAAVGVLAYLFVGGGSASPPQREQAQPAVSDPSSRRSAPDAGREIAPMGPAVGGISPQASPAPVVGVTGPQTAPRREPPDIAITTPPPSTTTVASSVTTPTSPTPTTATPTTPAPTTTPANSARPQPEPSLISTAAIERIRAETASVTMSSSACVTVKFRYAWISGSETVNGSSSCARSHSLLLGSVTDPLLPGTTYNVTITAVDSSGNSEQTSLRFTTLG